MKVYRPIRLMKRYWIQRIILVTDKKGDILYVNDYFCEITGYQPNEVIGAPHNIIRHPRYA